LLSRYISPPLFHLLFHSTLTLLDPLTYYPTYSNPRFPQFPLSRLCFYSQNSHSLSVLYPRLHSHTRSSLFPFFPLWPHEETLNTHTRPPDLLHYGQDSSPMDKTLFTLVQVPHSPQSSTTRSSPWALLPSSSI